jgi:hypothetical protein
MSTIGWEPEVAAETQTSWRVVLTVLRTAIGSPLRYTRSHVVSGVSNNGYGCFADLPYLSDP